MSLDKPMVKRKVVRMLVAAPLAQRCVQNTASASIAVDPAAEDICHVM